MALTVSAVMPIAVVVRRAAALAVCVILPLTITPAAGADPDSSTPQDGRVPPGDPATVNTPDGWVLALGARDEMQVPVPPLTTAISSREYLASGTFIGSL